MLLFACNTHSLSLKQVDKYYATNSLQPEVHMGKLQLTVTSTSNNHMKVSWLVWWNSSTPTRAIQKFLDVLVGEEKLSTWLKKAYWYVGISLISLFWIIVQFSFVLNLTIYSNYDIFEVHCIFKLIDVAVDSFNSIVAKDVIVLNLSGLDGPNTLLVYFEKWHMQLWNLVFSTIFKDVYPFKKIDVFVDYCGVTLIVKR